MFKIEWLRNGGVVDRETSEAKVQAAAIAGARARASQVAARLPDRKPDSFRVLDATGKEIGVFPLEENR
jgi:hypothetical protein